MASIYPLSDTNPFDISSCAWCDISLPGNASPEPVSTCYCGGQWYLLQTYWAGSLPSLLDSKPDFKYRENCLSKYWLVHFSIPDFYKIILPTDQIPSRPARLGQVSSFETRLFSKIERPKGFGWEFWQLCQGAPVFTQPFW